MASVPSSPRSGEADVEKQLQSLKSAIFSPSATMETISDALTKLVAIYSCADELTFLPGSGQRRRAAAEAKLDRSLLLLDLCDAMQQSFAEIKATVQDMQLARRRGDSAAVHGTAQSYARSTKKAQRHFRRIIGSTSKSAASEMEACRVVRLLAEARENGISCSERK